MKRTLLVLAATVCLPLSAMAATFQIDEEGQHAFINFRIQHLGFSWLYGTFKDFGGQFQFDPENPDDASVEVTIDPASVDTNNAERDKHLRSDEFFDVSEYPQAKFVSTGADLDAHGNGTVTGDLTLHGVTNPVTLEVESIGAGDDPWGGYRHGFLGKTEIALKDYGIDYDLGPAAENVELTLSVEGVRQ